MIREMMMKTPEQSTQSVGTANSGLVLPYLSRDFPRRYATSILSRTMFSLTVVYLTLAIVTTIEAISAIWITFVDSLHLRGSFPMFRYPAVSSSYSSPGGVIWDLPGYILMFLVLASAARYASRRARFYDLLDWFAAVFATFPVVIAAAWSSVYLLLFASSWMYEEKWRFPTIVLPVMTSVLAVLALFLIDILVIYLRIVQSKEPEPFLAKVINDGSTAALPKTFLIRYGKRGRKETRVVVAATIMSFAHALFYLLICQQLIEVLYLSKAEKTGWWRMSRDNILHVLLQGPWSIPILASMAIGFFCVATVRGTSAGSGAILQWNLRVSKMSVGIAIGFSAFLATWWLLGVLHISVDSPGVMTVVGSIASFVMSLMFLDLVAALKWIARRPKDEMPTRRFLPGK